MTDQTERLGLIGHWSLDVETMAPTWSDGVYRIFNVALVEQISLEGVIARYSELFQAQLNMAIAGAISSGQPFDLTLTFKLSTGMDRWQRWIGEIEPGGGGARYLVGVLIDVTAEKQAEVHLLHLATHDPLTGLANRRLLTEALQTRADCRKRSNSMIVVMLDIDYFKPINDLYGHTAGDTLLVEVARRLQVFVRPDELVGRLGGDEFVLVLDGAADVKGRLDGILRIFDDEISVLAADQVINLTISVSVGAVVSRGECISPDTMFRRADIALYEAKSRGRGQACVFKRSLGVQTERRVDLLEEVRLGLRRDEFDVYYQPIVDLRTSEVRGFEALVRWQHPTRGLLTPAAFSAALEDHALSAKIGAFVLDRSLGQLRQWSNQSVPVLCVNVNISRSQLQSGDELSHQVEALLKKHDLSPDRLKLEILESAFLGDRADAVADVLRRLRQFGVISALDDFGTGYASLTHLKTFDVGRIKIDKSFISGLEEQQSNRVITQAIIDLGANLGMRVVAEGVETLYQLKVLVAGNCDCGQGYLFSRPMPRGEVAGFLARWRHYGHRMLLNAGNGMPEVLLAKKNDRHRHLGARPGNG